MKPWGHHSVENRGGRLVHHRRRRAQLETRPPRRRYPVKSIWLRCRSHSFQDITILGLKARVDSGIADLVRVVRKQPNPLAPPAPAPHPGEKEGAQLRSAAPTLRRSAVTSKHLRVQALRTVAASGLRHTPHDWPPRHEVLPPPHPNSPRPFRLTLNSEILDLSTAHNFFQVDRGTAGQPKALGRPKREIGDQPDSLRLHYAIGAVPAAQSAALVCERSVVVRL